MDRLRDPDPFQPFGPSHVGVVGALVVVAVALVLLGRRQRDSAAERRTSQVLALVVAVFLIPLETYWLLPQQWNIQSSLPLQLCDLAGFAAVWALWTRHRAAHALAYYWGLTLTVQAFITPELHGPDFPSVEFLMFFGLHSMVVWVAVYLTWGVGLRLDWGSYRVAVLGTAAWAAVMFVFNLVAGTNYGFLNAKPQAASVLDLLGPWPWYLLSEMVLIAAGWALLTWPWVLRRNRRTRREARRPAAAPDGPGEQESQRTG